MSCYIKRNPKVNRIDLMVQGNIIAGFPTPQYDFTDAQLRLIGFMCEKAVRAGKDLKAEQIRNVIGA